MPTKKQREEMQEARDQLREILEPGSTVWTKIDHVSRSGMTRHVSVYVVDGDDIRPIHWTVAKACGYSMNPRRDAIVVGGCGFDAGFDIVHSLSYALHGMPGSEDRPTTEQAGYTLHHRSL